jgi:hypothetical protein
MRGTMTDLLLFRFADINASLAMTNKLGHVLLSVRMTEGIVLNRHHCTHVRPFHLTDFQIEVSLWKMRRQKIS